MVLENIRMAFASLFHAKVRSFLTMLGIIIGVAAVVAITAIGQGVKNSITEQVGGLGTNLLAISSGNNEGGANFAAGIGSSTLTSRDVDSVRQTDNIVAASYIGVVSGVINRAGRASNGGIIAATTPDYDNVRDLKLEAGRFFGSTDAERDVIVLGNGAKTALFGSAGAVGQTVTFRGQSLEVIGVVAAPEQTSALGGAQNDASFLPAAAAERITGAPVQIFQIIAKVASAPDVANATANIKTAIKANHGGETDFSVMTQDDLLATFDDILSLLTTFIAAIAAISLVVGGIGIMNIMLVSVTERTREIGLRKAIGASSGMVLGQFLIEAIILSLLGGLLGIAGAVGAAYGIGHLAGITPGFSVSSFALAVGVSAGVGVIFGIAPAIKAARMRPIQALKAT